MTKSCCKCYNLDSVGITEKARESKHAFFEIARNWYDHDVGIQCTKLV